MKAIKTKAKQTQFVDVEVTALSFLEDMRSEIFGKFYIVEDNKLYYENCYDDQVFVRDLTNSEIKVNEHLNGLIKALIDYEKEYKGD